MGVVLSLLLWIWPGKSGGRGNVSDSEWMEIPKGVGNNVVIREGKNQNKQKRAFFDDLHFFYAREMRRRDHREADQRSHRNGWEDLVGVQLVGDPRPSGFYNQFAVLQELGETGDDIF